MSERKTVRVSAVCLLVGLMAVLFFAACSSKAVSAADKIELGQKYLSEMNYTEAIASFTEAIRLDPENIQAYMGRAEAYLALGEYEKALEDYQFVSGKTEEMPYTRALSYAGQAEVYEKTDEPDHALSCYRLAKVLLTASDVGKAESITEDDVKVKLVEVLYAHAMISEKIKSYDKALEDYDELLELGEKVEGKRDSLLEELGQPTDEENGLTEAEPAADADAAEKAEENPEEKTAESVKEEPAASSEQAASSKASVESTASSEVVSSSAASSEAPAESKEEQPVVQEPVTSYSYSGQETFGVGTRKMTVSYQIGGNTIALEENGAFTSQDQFGETSNWTSQTKMSYTLSQPLLAVERHQSGDYFDNAVDFIVPAGTVLTYYFINKYDGSTASETSKICAIDESGTLYVGDSLTMQAGRSYAMYDEYDESGSNTTGNVTFKAR